MAERFIVTLTRMSSDGVEYDCEVVVLGPFRSHERALERAAVIRRLADQYEDPEGVTGPDNAIDVIVEPLRPGRTSAQDALDYLYGSIE